MTSGWRSAPGTPGRSGCKGLSSGNRAGVHALCLVARRSPAGRHLDVYRQRLARVWADRLGRHERRRGVPGKATPRSCDRSPSAPTARGWRRAARKGSCGCSTRRMAGSAPPCSPGHERQRPGVQPRWPPALRRRLGDGRGQGLRPGPRSPRPAHPGLARADRRP